MPRRNPVSTLVELAFADQGSFLKELQETEEFFDFESAAFVLSEWTGKGHEEMRSRGLRIISDYVRKNFNDAAQALHWLHQRSQRLCVWCACACAREILDYGQTPSVEERFAIEQTEDWVRAKVPTAQIRKLCRKLLFRNIADPWKGTHIVCILLSLDRASFVASNAVSFIVEAEMPGSNSDADRLSRIVSKRMVGVICDAIMTFPQRDARSFLRRNPAK